MKKYQGKFWGVQSVVFWVFFISHFSEAEVIGLRETSTQIVFRGIPIRADLSSEFVPGKCYSTIIFRFVSPQWS